MECLARVCVCVVVCLFLIMMRCGVSGLCVCCGVFVPDYDEVWSVWLVCVCVCVCCGVFVPDYDEVWSVWLVCVCVCVCCGVFVHDYY